MAELQILFTKEKIMRTQLEKFIENGKKTGLPKRTQGFFEQRMLDLRTLWAEYCLLDQEIQIKLENSTLENVQKYQGEDTFGMIEIKYAEYIGELAEGLRKLVAPTQAFTTVAPTVPPTQPVLIQQETSLPRITIPKYNGDYDMWRSFRDLFVSLVHNNVQLTRVQKLYHLKACLTGDAEKLLRHTPITDADYEPAWIKLTERYENKRILVSHQLKILVNQPKINTERIKDIKALIDTTSECLQQLKSLEVDTDSWDVLLIHILTQKLPYLTLRLWEEDQGTKQELPDYNSFNEFLQKRLKILEAIAEAMSGSSTAKPLSKANTYTHLSVEPNKCPACNEKHYVLQCKKYNQLKAYDKLKVIKASGRCINCFSKQHFVKDCCNKNRCFKCKQKHHTTLHDASNNTHVQGQVAHYEQKINAVNNSKNEEARNYNKDNTNNTRLRVANGTEEALATQTFVTRKDHQTLLSTALVSAQSEQGESHTLRCLLDTGSQSSFITEEACNKLKAPWVQTSTSVTGLNTSHAAFASRKTTLHLRSKGSDNTRLQEEFFIIKQITDALPTRTVAKADCQHLQGLELADPTFWKPGKIDALLGAQTFAKIIQEGVQRGHATAPVALKTMFGWILLGATSKIKTKSNTTLITTTCDLNLDEQLKKFWEIEEVATERILSEAENECQRIYDVTTQRLPTGKYRVKLPFIGQNNPTLGQSRLQAVKRYTQLQKKFSENPDLERDYKKCLNEYLELEHMEAVNPPTDGEPHYYIPHHAVLKESTTTKLRVVFDASAKTTNGHSLNEQMLKGPTLQPKLYSTLLNWRKYKIALNADIEKMYRMIEIHPDHRTYQRIIWQHPTSKEMQDFQLKTVTFGTSAAPYLAIRTLQQLAADEKDNWPKASAAVHNAFYVDDVLTGADSIEEAKQLQYELISLMKSGGFNLRKWASNESSLLEILPLEYREPKIEKVLLEDEAMKALGVRWHPASDQFSFKVNSIQHKVPATKRTILSEIATLYDPLGWLAPVLIRGKMLMQMLWISGNLWDNPVPDSIQEQWNNFKEDLYNINHITIPRWVNYTTQSNAQLHGFCDASEKAYAAAIYLRIVSQTGKITCHLLTAKTRVAPTKPVTIPRLELNGAVLLARLMKATLEDMQLNNIPIYAWTDSSITLQWIQEHPSRWKTYVANRVVEIQNIIRFENWKHVPTKDNPADIASRGTTAGQLINQKIWWYGPAWLVQDSSNWPRHQVNLGKTNHEERISKCSIFLSTTNNDFLTRYSSYNRLLRITATVLRFKHNCQQPQNKKHQPLACADIQAAENAILKILQKSTFSQEYRCLLYNKHIPRNSKLLKLTPFMDNEGLIRVGGRLENAPISYDRKHPIILPQAHHITSILINKVHIEMLHGGAAVVINTIRNKFWILNARRTISSNIHKCIKCVRQRSMLHKQLMGNLPMSRVNISKPFSKVGIDYAGPVIIRASKLRNAKTQKAYICVFVCMTTKAIHIELVSDLTSEAFLAALKRFVARRGLCTDIYSDCGTNFVGANTTLRAEYKTIEKTQREAGTQFCASNRIHWHFNPPSSPHFGGLWEAGVKSVKYHIKRVLGNAVCTFEEYATVLTQIEACLNSRPLYYMPNSADDTFILSPGHFLIGQSWSALPEKESTSMKILPSQRWKYTQQLVKQFWDKWSTDYLNQLQHRPKWQQVEHNIQPGEMVLVKAEQMPPNQWPLGIVSKIFPGKDDLVRVVEVRTNNGFFKRPVAKLCRLPVQRC